MLNRNLPQRPKVPLKQRVVNSVYDFPEPSAGVITLPPGYRWHIGETITMSDKLYCSGDCAISGLWLYGGAQLTYTGSGTFITIEDGWADISRIFMTCPSAQAFSITNNSTPIIYGASMSEVLVYQCDSIGTFTDVAVNAVNFGALVANNGVTILKTYDSPIIIASLRQTNVGQLADAGVGIELGDSLFNTLEFRDVIFNAAPAASTIGISGRSDGTANMNPGFVALIDSCEFGTGVTPLGDWTLDDIRLQSLNNSGLSSTYRRALLSVTSNTTESTITTIGVPAPVLASTWSLDDASHWTSDAPTNPGRLVHLDEVERAYHFDIYASVRQANGSGDSATVYVYKNGVAVPGARGAVEDLKSNLSSNVSIPVSVTATEDDYFDIYIANNSTTTNLVVRELIVRVKE